MKTNQDSVRDFIAAWSRLDIEELIAFFAPDGRYHNMMLKPVTGHEASRKFIGGFVKDWTATRWDIVHILGEGDVVVVERIDRTQLRNASVDLPCCGVFEMRGGKIRIWRDYFDLDTYRRALP